MHVVQAGQPKEPIRRTTVADSGCQESELIELERVAKNPDPATKCLANLCRRLIGENGVDGVTGRVDNFLLLDAEVPDHAQSAPLIVEAKPLPGESSPSAPRMELPFSSASQVLLRKRKTHKVGIDDRLTRLRQLNAIYWEIGAYRGERTGGFHTTKATNDANHSARQHSCAICKPSSVSTARA